MFRNASYLQSHVRSRRFVIRLAVAVAAAVVGMSATTAQPASADEVSPVPPFKTVVANVVGPCQNGSPSVYSGTYWTDPRQNVYAAQFHHSFDSSGGEEYAITNYYTVWSHNTYRKYLVCISNRYYYQYYWGTTVLGCKLEVWLYGLPMSVSYKSTWNLVGLGSPC
jgi:hypothetical protein